MAENINATVIGAGQAGLAIGYYLSQLGRQYVILEQDDAIASAWRKRWDSFTLVTPNWSLNMPDFAYSEDDPDGFLSRMRPYPILNNSLPNLIRRFALECALIL